MPSKRYTVLVADRATGVVRRFTLSLGPTVAVATTLLALPILIGLGARWSARVEIAELRANNVALVVENESYRAATGQLAAQVSSLQAAIAELSERATVDPAVQRAMRNLPELDRARAMGGGGVVREPARSLFSATFNSPDNTFGILRDLLSVLESRLEAVRYGVERRQALAAATPSMWPATGWLSSAFGGRVDPFNGGESFHPGIDISADYGAPVYATADGRVESASYSGNYGNLVVIDHGFGIATRYGHLSRFAVRAGQSVKRGDLIGYVGSTGRSTSPHLHYEVTLNGRLINPLRLLSERRPS
jgi:murein DD-endopeptidase MepM/ murein hydrolase activator NlpD